jgi:hypothetical protein
MIATDHFVYLHLHKSGGTFLNECLMKHFPGARHIGYHLPRRLIPARYQRLPVLGFVRNPWSYYVSWFAFQSQRQAPNALFEIASEGGRLDFKATIGNLLALGSGSPQLDQLLPMLAEDYINHGLNLPRFALEPIRNSGLGFYTYLYRYMYLGVGESLTIGRAENLQEEFLDFLARIGVTPSPAALEFLRTEAARNTSAHGRIEDYYDAELRDLVAERDRTVIETYGYRFGEG